MKSKKAITKMQAIIIAVIIIVAAIIGVAVVVFWPEEEEELPPGKGWLDVDAFVGTSDVTASVDVEGVGVHSTSFKIALDPGNYTLTATYTYSTYPKPPPKTQTETAEVIEGDTTEVEFTFPETIKIGICADLDEVQGIGAWEGAVLAAEQVNAEGGVLGRYFEIVGEDNDEAAPALDLPKVSTALTRLITLHEVDLVIGGFRTEAVKVMQDITALHKIIFINIGASTDELTQNVLDNYDKYKYFFRTNPTNSTILFQTILSGVATLRANYTGFNKVAYLAEDLEWTVGMRAGLDYYLPNVYGFELVYKGAYPVGTTDFSSYFAAMEAAGTEIMIPIISAEGGLPVIKEWAALGRPFVVWGINVWSQESEFWKWTDEACLYESTMVGAFVAGYPMTDKTLPARAAFIDKWGHTPTYTAPGAYDTVRFILPDAIERAGTTETDAVIEALEETDIETTAAQHFVFTSGHDVMAGPGYVQILFFQWQPDGTRVPVYPIEIMEEVGGEYLLPP